MAQTLRPYQQEAFEHIVAFVDECIANEATGRAARRPYASPTGSGKGTLQLALQRHFQERGQSCWIVTPSLEVVRGFLERLGVPAEVIDDASAAKLADMAWERCIATPITFRNHQLNGQIGSPDIILYDECHHAVEDSLTGGVLFANCPGTVFIGFTATAFRGTPAGTVAFKEAWGETYVILTFPEAVELGACALPTFHIVPLVDDDEIKVGANGEFVAKGLTSAVGSRIEELALLATGWDEKYPADADLPTAVIVPSDSVAGDLVSALDRLDVPGYWVHAGTKSQERAQAYAAARECRGVLISIGVIAEGVDFPWLRQMIDASPTLSPVAWAQRIGRIMRPDPRRSRYICVCRNMERHAYLLEGLVPREAMKQAQEAFVTPSKRMGRRALGLEALSRFKAIELPLANGGTGVMHALYSVDPETGKQTDYVTILDPIRPEPIYATRINTRNPDTWELQFGKWSRIDALPADFVGYQTMKWKGALSERQRKGWKYQAEKVGLAPDPDAVTQRHYAALAALLDIKERLY